MRRDIRGVIGRAVVNDDHSHDFGSFLIEEGGEASRQDAGLVVRRDDYAQGGRTASRAVVVNFRVVPDRSGSYALVGGNFHK